MIRRSFAVAAGSVLLGALLTGLTPAAAQDKKVVVAIPGIPPIYSVTIAFVAEKQGFFRKHGVNVEIKPFDNGTAAARAVVAGDIDMAWSPTPPVINQVSNAEVPLVAVYGMPNPDWVVGTTEEGKACKDMIGQDVAVDSINGARSVALRSMLTGCPGVKIEDVKQVALGSTPGRSPIPGRSDRATSPAPPARPRRCSVLGARRRRADRCWPEWCRRSRRARLAFAW